MCVAGAGQRRDKSPDVEDVQPNFGEVRGRFERLSLPSLIEVKKNADPSSQRQSATSLTPSPKLQCQEKATKNMAKLVEERKMLDNNNQPGSDYWKGEGRVRELVRMIDVSKGRINQYFYIRVDCTL